MHACLFALSAGSSKQAEIFCIHEDTMHRCLYEGPENGARGGA